MTTEPGGQPVDLPEEEFDGRQVKYTVQLDERHNRTLKLLALDAGAPSSNCLRSLLELVEQDPFLRARIIRLASKDR